MGKFDKVYSKKHKINNREYCFSMYIEMVTRLCNFKNLAEFKFREHYI